MPVINVEVGSPEWFKLRREHITSTDAAIINGTNTFGGNSPRLLWERKLQLIPEENSNYKMEEGKVLEGEARDLYNSTFGSAFEPQVYIHDEHFWAMASLDGFYEDCILEIKCGKKAYEQAKAGVIPPYYYDQIQHAMFCRGVRKALYLAYRPDEEPIVLPLEADDKYMEALREKEANFYFNYLTVAKPPENTAEDAEPLIDDERIAFKNQWVEAKLTLDAAKQAEKAAKEAFLAGLEGRKYICEDVKIGWTVKRGDIDWKQVREKFDISEEDLDSCRRKSSSFFTLKCV